MPATIEGLGLRSDEVAGRTILNVGSSQGNLCIAALELGAARVLGVDIDLNRVQAAREKTAAGRPKAEFVQADFETWQSSEEFDLVICSNVLHQVLDPIHALRRMMRMARERIVVEFSPPALTDVRKFNVSLSALLARGSSLISPAFSRFNTEAYSRTFALTPSALSTLIDRHSNAFEPVQISRSPQKDRYIATASRRRIDQLTVIAGPTSAGKGTLFRSLDAELRSQLGVPLTDSGYVTASLARTLPRGHHSHVVLHYDMLRPFETSLHDYERDLAVDLIRVAQRITFLTIYADPERLQQQITASEIDSRSPGKQSHRHLRIREFYRDPGFIASWYSRWLEFCETFREKTSGSFFLQNRGDYTILPATRETLASLLASTQRNVGIQKDA
jgi:hypothetical protein